MWLPDKDPENDGGNNNWLAPGDIEANPLKDFYPMKDNSVSLYQVEDDDEASIKRIVAAITLMSYPKDIEYTLIPPETLQLLEFEVEDIEAKTLDDDVNNWHRDIVRLSGTKMAKLGRAIKDLLTEGEYETFTEDDVIQAIVDSVKSKHVARGKVIKAQRNQPNSSSKKLLQVLENLPSTTDEK